MQTIKKLAGIVSKYGILAWMAAMVVWYIIVSTLRNGISCDEGYYLMGYLRGQSIEGIGTDFHAIVRALCRPFSDSDIMVFRYTRLVLGLVAVICFAVSSYEWLFRKKRISTSRWAYYPVVMLAGAMAFTFAAPTISYDSLELGIVMLAASLLFIMFASERNWVKSVSSLGIGFLLWFACSNYPPAGVCIVILFIAAYFLEEEKIKWDYLAIALLGVIGAILVSHFFIHDMKVWFSEMSKVFVSTFTEESKSRHDAGSLISTMLITVAKALLVFIPTVVVSALIYKRVHISDKIKWVVTLLICASLLIVRNVYELRGLLYLVPIALVSAKIFAQPGFSLKKFLLSKDYFLALVLIAIPFAGVFGTNQPILKKVVIYMPFWLLSFFYLSSMLKSRSNKRLTLVIITVLFAGYVWLGNFQRYHYYYTPRSSHYELVGASRQQRVMVSQYQQQYFNDLLDTLRVSGCKPGDTYMAFGENQMAVYLAGGYIDGRLPYHWWQYKHFEDKAPQAFILFKKEEDDVIDYFKEAKWGFPADYNRMEMRQMSQNMGDDLRTVIYVKTNR